MRSLASRAFRRVNRNSRLFSGAARDSEYPGVPTSKWTNTLEVLDNYPVADYYRVMDLEGKLINPEYEVKVSDDVLQKMLVTMTELQSVDEVFYNAQRQGRISFYMTNSGEEAAAIGSAAALDPEDIIYTQYREAGVFMWRGFTIENIAHQCFSNELDLGKGRQMPVHYGSAKLNMHTVSSPLATQIPQATGAAYALKLEGKPNIVACYFGDGAASEGDAHTAMNFAATTESPVLFFIRNNGFAISTHAKDQYRGDGILSRAAGYDIPAIRVDGNDVLAVHEATEYARKFMLEHQRPFLIEALSYRGGHHSTSDDSTRYRPSDEIQHWQANNHPVTRLRLLMEDRGIWDADQQVATSEEARRTVLKMLVKAETMRKPPVSQMFSDVYDEMPWHIKEQSEQLAEHLRIHNDKYPNHQFQDDDTYIVPDRNSS